MAVMRPEAIMKSIIPVVMAGIIAIYGVVVAVLIAGQLSSTGYTLYQVMITLFAHLLILALFLTCVHDDISHCASLHIINKCF